MYSVHDDMAYDATQGGHDGLPDPTTQPGFYTGTATKRGIAWVIDCAIIFTITLVILPFTAFLGLLIYAGLWAVVSFIYRVASISQGSGTWGMRIMSLELRDSRGERLDFSQAFAHTAGYFVSVAFFPLQVISILLMLGTERGQGLSDHVLGTAALNRRA